MNFGPTPHQTLCHPIGVEDFRPYVRLLTACDMAVGLESVHSEGCWTWRAWGGFGSRQHNVDHDVES